MDAQIYFIRKHAVFRMFKRVPRETDGCRRSTHAKLARLGLKVCNQMILRLLQIVVEYTRIALLSLQTITEDLGFVSKQVAVIGRMFKRVPR